MTSDNAQWDGPQATGSTSDNAKPFRARAIAADYRYLSAGTSQCEALAVTIDNIRGATALLTLLAERDRGVLSVIDAEPGLHTYLGRLAYGRIRTVARNDAERREHPQHSNAELRQNAEALAARADELGTAAVQHPPRLRLDTMAGSRALSHRLVDVRQLDQAADTIDAALAAARRLPHPNPVVDTLTTLAAGLREQTAALRTSARAGEDWWTDYFDHLRREADAAAQRERAETDRLHAEARRLSATPARS